MAEIKIIVERQNRNFTSQLDAKPQSKGIIRRKREDETLGRRAKKQEAGINFYDLGRIKVEGVWTDLEFNVSKPVIAQENGYAISPPEISKEDAETYRDALIFAYDKENWKNLFYRIEKSYVSSVEEYNENDADFSSRYILRAVLTDESFNEEQIDFGSNDKWTNGGLKLTPEDLEKTLTIFAVSNFYFNEIIDFNNYNYRKITAIHDFEAEAVSFTPTNKMDIFWMPNFVVNYGRGFIDNKTVWLNYFLNNHSREQFLNHYRKAHADFVFPSGVGYTTDEGAIKTRTVAYAKNLTGNRTFVDEINEDESHTTYEGDGSEFPVGVELFGEFVSTEPSEFVATPEAGILVAVVNQNNDWFYIWTDETV